MGGSIRRLRQIEQKPRVRELKDIFWWGGYNLGICRVFFSFEDDRIMASTLLA